MTLRSISLQNFQTTRVFPPHSFVQISWCTRSFINWFIPPIMMRMPVLFTLITVFHTALVMGNNCTNVTKPLDTFDCFNNSTCTKDAHDNNETLQFFTFENYTLDMHKERTRDGYHCRCLKGWTGLRCNTKLDTCGTRGHKCL